MIFHCHYKKVTKDMRSDPHQNKLMLVISLLYCIPLIHPLNFSTNHLIIKYSNIHGASNRMLHVLTAYKFSQ